MTVETNEYCFSGTMSAPLEERPPPHVRIFLAALLAARVHIFSSMFFLFSNGDGKELLVGGFLLGIEIW